MMARLRSYKGESKTSFDEQAADYDASLSGRHSVILYERVVRALDRHEYGAVLDVGCGTGNLLAAILQRRKVAAAGIDLSEKMIEKARERLDGGVDLRVGDSERLPWNDGTFDIVTCTDSFHHYPSPIAALKEMRRVLRPGGLVIIADPWAPMPFRQLANAVLPFRKKGDVRLYSEQEMKKLLDESGLKVMSWETIGISAFVLVATAASSFS